MEGAEQPVEYDKSNIAFDGPARYRIRVLGSPLFDWSDRLGGLTIKVETPDDPDGVTVFEGWMTDQAALSGVLNTLYESHLALVSVEALAVEPENTKGDARDGAE